MNSAWVSSGTANIIGQPNGGAGVSLQSQGFVTGAGTQGIAVLAPQYEGVENVVFPSFVMGVPVTNVSQWNNTLYLSDSVSKVIGTHTLKFGGQFHDDQVNENPNGTFNGTFSFEGTETGNRLRRFPSGLSQQLHAVDRSALLPSQQVRCGFRGR